jgi:hypothetical protein
MSAIIQLVLVGGTLILAVAVVRDLISDLRQDFGSRDEDKA